MIRYLLLSACACAALTAADTHPKKRELGTLLARQVIDAGHILEVRALPSAGNGANAYLVRWGDLDNAIPAKTKGHFDWSGSASVSGGQVSAVRLVAFEDGSKNGKAQDKKSRPGDRLVGDGYAGSVAWQARTSCAWDGVVIHARGDTLAVQAGPASLSVALR
jgi:hypothetical protein